MTKYIIGIDPGAEGAVALFDRHAGMLIDVWDMPCDVVRVGRTDRPRVSAPRLAALIRPLPAAAGWLEKVGPAPRQSAAATFTFGTAAGIPEGVLAALGIPLTRVSPQEWKAGTRCPTDKNGARARASQLFPGHAAAFARGKDDGRAEAALIAYYGASRAP